jgi:hypothetical protein
VRRQRIIQKGTGGGKSKLEVFERVGEICVLPNLEAGTTAEAFQCRFFRRT